MAWWNKQSEEAELQRWDCAKEITAAEAANGTLPLGWYIYRDGYVWYGLKPNADNTALERSYHRSSPKELEEWGWVSLSPTQRAQRQAPPWTR